MAALLAHPVQREEVCTYLHSYFWKRLSYYLSFIDRISSDIHDILYLYFASVAIYLMPYLMSGNLIRALRLITYFTYHLRLLFSHTFPKIPSSLLYIHILKCVVQHFFLWRFRTTFIFHLLLLHILGSYDECKNGYELFTCSKYPPFNIYWG